ncbi:MAG: YfiR family protein [Candidatus Eisenbacteria sp.]|nr:YfiR family protein [Candidatus Eisenbacteria bacterium]
MRRLFTRLLFLGVLCTASMIPSSTPASQPTEYELKAAFLYNFAKFVTWPTNSFSTINSVVTIGILGDDLFGSALDTVLEGKTVKRRAFVIRRSCRIDEVKDCAIVYISLSERGRVRRILDALEGHAVLTVSDLDDFARSGGIINFFMEHNRLRFAINISAADKAGLKISSKLLSLATVVNG